MTLHLAIVILTVWVTAVIVGIIGKVIDNEEMVEFADICAWTVAGVSSVGCALYVLGHHIEEAKEPQSVSQLCIVYNGTEYCSTQHIETETIIIDVDGNDSITVKIK
jgi:hypothetical protein